MTNLKRALARTLILAIGFILHMPASAGSPGHDPLSEDTVLRDPKVLHDPDVPVLGNPNGDVTIVEYFDYQCPPCKAITPEVANIVREDGHVRLVFKDWPILGDASVYAAKLALATKYQNKFAAAHDALISTKTRLSEERVQRTMAAAGIDVERAKSDLAAHQKKIDGILARNNWQALSLGFQGPPAFVVGHVPVPGILNSADLGRAIAAARAAAKRN